MKPLRIRTLTLAAAMMVTMVVSGATDTAVSLAVKGRSNANASIAADRRFVVVVWGATPDRGATDIYSAVSTDGGRTFGRPSRVNDGSGEVRLSGEQPPRVALVPRPGRDPSISVVWTAKGADGTKLLSARSEDGGASFGRSTDVPGTDAPGNRGWESVTTEPDGRVSAVWLDHRDLAQAGKETAPMRHDGQHHAGHAMQTDSVSRAQLSKLYFARVDGSTGATALAGGVCYCCKTAVAAGPDGSVYAAWRQVYPGNVRDIAFTVSRDAGRTFAPPIRVSEDLWVLDGCPENGPALAVDVRNAVHVVWPTLVSGATSADEPTLALFYASTADGRGFSPRQQIPTEGVARHPQIAITPRRAPLVAWDEQMNGTRRVVVAEVVGDGRGSVHFPRRTIGGPERGEYPVVAGMDDGFVVAWTSGAPTQSVIRVERFVRPH